MRLIVRVDANTKSGMGHFARTMSLVESINMESLTILIVGDFTNSHVIKTIQSKSRKTSRVTFLNIANISIQNFIELCNQDENTIALLDNLFVNSDWEYALSKSGIKLITVIDRPTYPLKANIVISPNLYVDFHSTFEKYVDNETQLFVGPQYLPFNSELLEAGTRRRDRTSIKIITSYFGSVDIENQTGRVLETSRFFPDIFFQIVTGDQNARFTEYKLGYGAAKKCKYRLSCNRFLQNA